MKILRILLSSIIIIALGFGTYIIIEKIKHKHKDHPVISDISNESIDNDNDEHEEHLIELTQEEIGEIGLKTSFAGPGTIDKYLNLSGEIGFNRDKMAHIVPKVEGIVSEVNKTLGDIVHAGDILAVIESPDLADAKAEYLAAIERYKTAQLAFQREEKLWADKISSEQEYLNSKQLFIETEIEKRTAKQKLYAIGFKYSNIEELPNEPDEQLTRYEITAPFESTIIEKHIVQGEKINNDSPIYILADLNTVWVDLNVYPKDLDYIKNGQDIAISINPQTPDINGVISYISPIVSDNTRNAIARAVIPNKSGLFRPGLFVNAKVLISSTDAKIVVPRKSIQILEGRKCVFIKDEHGFEPVFVETGHEDSTHVEISSGLDAEQEYVTEGAFLLKSMIITSTLDSHAGHGH